MFWGYKAQLQRRMQKIYYFDGCFLKGLVKGQLLVTIGQDGNNQMFPIAWAVINGQECYYHWKWFIGLLMEDLGIETGLGWCVISNMQKVALYT